MGGVSIYYGGKNEPHSFFISIKYEVHNNISGKKVTSTPSVVLAFAKGVQNIDPHPITKFSSAIEERIRNIMAEKY